MRVSGVLLFAVTVAMFRTIFGGGKQVPGSTLMTWNNEPITYEVIIS